MTIASKLLITALALWAAVFPDKALVALDNASGSLLNHFNVYYVYVVSLFLFFCIVMTMIPAIAKRKLG
ncbi:BCCT family transporter, partial [Nitrosomonas sp.]|uniref:BCCT family transporter n=1 Tax=Nitrosomonas sp. TaxID=42353 RepID=UPI001DE5192A